MEKIYEKKGSKWNNEYFDNGDDIIIKISKEESKEIYDILIDKEDFDKVKEGQWYVGIKRKNTHLKEIPSILWSKKENGKKINYEIYQLILGTKFKNVIVDHINENRFDNRKSNLRITNNSVNSFNCKRKGYSYDKKNNKYRASIKINHKELKLGRYDTELEAETIYLKVCMVLGIDKISTYIANRVGKLNLVLTKEDYENKYIIRAIDKYKS